ncbi:cupin domain-containing protein [Kitasatospora sp. cg17-2]
MTDSHKPTEPDGSERSDRLDRSDGSQEPDGTPGPDLSGDGVAVEALLREAGADAAGALWRLTGTERQLDANVVRLRPGAAVAAHVEPDLDVLVLGLTGQGTLRCAGVEHTLEPGALRLLPHGAERAVAAGAEGVVYLTVHRRRPGLAVRPRP